MKFRQLVEYNKKDFFLQKLCGKGGRQTSSTPLLVFLKKTLYEVEASGLQLNFNIFR